MPDASGPAGALATTATGALRAAPLPRRILHRQLQVGQEALDQVRGAADRTAIGRRPAARGDALGRGGGPVGHDAAVADLHDAAGAAGQRHVVRDHD